MQLLFLCLLDLNLRTFKRQARIVEIMELSILESSSTSESAKVLEIHSTSDISLAWSETSLSSACVVSLVVKPAITPSSWVQKVHKCRKSNRERAVYVIRRHAHRCRVIG
jgi:hypothetical protein